MKVVLKDMLQEKGRWSIKRSISLVVILFVLGLGTFIVVSDKILNTVVNPYAIQVFNSLLAFEITLLGITEFGKKLIDKVDTSNNSEN